MEDIFLMKELQTEWTTRYHYTLTRKGYDANRGKHHYPGNGMEQLSCIAGGNAELWAT